MSIKKKVKIEGGGVVCLSTYLFIFEKKSFFLFITLRSSLSAERKHNNCKCQLQEGNAKTLKRMLNGEKSFTAFLIEFYFVRKHLQVKLSYNKLMAISKKIVTILWSQMTTLTSHP